ncbi:MYXO-CTERM sorting domain-containing protein [Hyalangium versicolor]|nr:MYXO-CTERM sorting domain-containing protein [Hyalangium versicolor]
MLRVKVLTVQRVSVPGQGSGCSNSNAERDGSSMLALLALVGHDTRRRRE